MLRKSREAFKSAVKWLLLAAGVGTMFAQNENKLFDAVRSGDSRKVRAVLSERVEASATNSSGQTALILAAALGRADTVRLLLEHHAPGNAKNQNGATALMVASTSGHISVIKKLVKEEQTSTAAITPA